jgi:hypothetical protein
LAADSAIIVCSSETALKRSSALSNFDFRLKNIGGLKLSIARDAVPPRSIDIRSR